MSSLKSVAIIAAAAIWYPGCAVLSPKRIPADELKASEERIAANVKEGADVEMCRRLLEAEGFEESDRKSLLFSRIESDGMFYEIRGIVELEADGETVSAVNISQQRTGL